MEDLFGFLSVVVDRKSEIKKLVEKLKSLRKAITSDWLKGMTKKEYEDAKREMESLKTDVDKVKLSVSDDAEAIESGVDPRALKLKSQVNYLSRKRGALNARRSKIESLSDNQEMTDADLDALRSFFPECELRDLSIVAEYRKQLIINVNAEAKEEIERIDSELSRIAAELARYKELLAEMKISPTVTKAKLEECIDKSGRLKALSARTARYEEKERLTASKKDLETKLAEDEKRYISQIEVSLNEELARLNGGLYSIERIPPTIKLESNKYDYKTVNDSGTGTLYKSLLVFDLALLNLTCLPFVIHDSLLFSDIWTEPVKGLFDIYALQRKQIFVSFDGANAQQETVKEIIGKSIKVKLGGGEESLFGWSWATK